MSQLESLKHRLAALKNRIYIPESSPWPPTEGSFSWCCYQRLGQPVERMGSMDMYLAVAEKVWAEIGDFL